jgi:hypothetical protein
MSVLSGLIPGTPGVKVGLSTGARIVFRSRKGAQFLAGGKIIDGLLARDTFNTGDTTVLQPGLLMGKVTATGKYANSVLGVSQNAYTSGGTTITVTAAQAAEIVRRVGATGTLKYVGPPSANGTNAVIAATAFSAVNTTTGAITVTSLGVNLVAGGLVVPTDGSETPVTFINDQEFVSVVGLDGVTGQDTEFPMVPIAGQITSSQLLPWPSDTSIQTWIETSLNAHGKFEMDHAY